MSQTFAVGVLPEVAEKGVKKQLPAHVGVTVGPLQITELFGSASSAPGETVLLIEVGAKNS